LAALEAILVAVFDNILTDWMGYLVVCYKIDVVCGVWLGGLSVVGLKKEEKR
jgi:hypothetical protein